MKVREKALFMDIAFRVSEMSRCNRKQVGCVIVKNGTPIAIGWNGTPSGEDNDCEDAEGKSKSNVVHAEDNALRKLTRSNESAEGASVFLTCAPCMRCAERLADAKIEKMYYAELYISDTHGLGLEYLEKHGIEIELQE